MTPHPARPDRPPDLRGWLEDALRRRAPAYAGPLEDDTPLTEDGLCLDSLALMDLLMEIEDACGIVLGEDEITSANLGTVGRLARFLESRAQPAARDPAQ